MNITTYITGVARDNWDGTSRQALLSRLRNNEDLYLYDAATERNPTAIAVINYDSQLCGFLDRNLAQAIRQYTNQIGEIVVFVRNVLPDQQGTLQCEIELDIPIDSPIGQEYEYLMGYGEEYAPVETQIRNRPVVRGNVYTDDATPSRQRTNETRLICPRCGSTNIHVQAVNEVKSKRGCFGCLMQMIALPMGCLMWLLTLLIPKKIKSKTRSYAVCQNCGNQWKV